MIKIDKPIVKQEVVTIDKQEVVTIALEKIPRTFVLSGKTYKIKSPLSEAALYVTINDMDGRPREIFINSRDMSHFQWMVATTRLLSAMFRKGGEIDFIVDELQSVVDPNGGYFKPGGQWVPSLVSEIGNILAEHLGILKTVHEGAKTAHEGAKTAHEGAKKCAKCGSKTVVLMDGCPTCQTCGDSKCG